MAREIVAREVVAREVVAIDGIDGSGKSMVAAALTAALAADAVPFVLLRVDDFRRPIDWARKDKSEADLYYDEYYDLPLLDRCLRDFLDGADGAEIPNYDTGSETLVGVRRIPFNGAMLAVVEGVFVLRVPTVERAAAVIYVDAGFDEARRRILVRDVARGRAPEEVSRRIGARYFPGQVRYRASLDPLSRAAAVIDNQHPETPRAITLDTSRLPAPVSRVLGALFGEARLAYS